VGQLFLFVLWRCKGVVVSKPARVLAKSYTGFCDAVAADGWVPDDTLKRVLVKRMEFCDYVIWFQTAKTQNEPTFYVNLCWDYRYRGEGLLLGLGDRLDPPSNRGWPNNGGWPTLEAEVGDLVDALYSPERQRNGYSVMEWFESGNTAEKRDAYFDFRAVNPWPPVIDHKAILKEVKAQLRAESEALKAPEVVSKHYVGFISIGEEPGAGVSVYAKSQEEAVALLVAEHGEGHAYALWLEDDASVPAGRH
jgi:hypothetical protein